LIEIVLYHVCVDAGSDNFSILLLRTFSFKPINIFLEEQIICSLNIWDVLSTVYLRDI